LQHSCSNSSEIETINSHSNSHSLSLLVDSVDVDDFVDSDDVGDFVDSDDVGDSDDVDDFVDSNNSGFDNYESNIDEELLCL